MNLLALNSLPQDSAGPKGTFQQRLEAVRSAGFAGVQFAERATPEELAVCRKLNLGIATSGRVNHPQDAASLAEQFAGDGFEAATLHVGWGLEDDVEAFRLIGSILEASTRWSIPLYIETHRATICQDMWRTVNFVHRFPAMRFNGDFSHWYTGQEMVYGGFEKKFAFIQPVLDRVRFLHGRISSPGCIQVAVEQDPSRQAPYVNHFRQLWTACFRGFLQSSSAADSICFAPELLAPDVYYARTFAQVEESDRWEQSLLLKAIAEQCFLCAQSS
jgi:hypothetical protein